MQPGVGTNKNTAAPACAAVCRSGKPDLARGFDSDFKFFLYQPVYKRIRHDTHHDMLSVALQGDEVIDDLTCSIVPVFVENPIDLPALIQHIEQLVGTGIVGGLLMPVTGADVRVICRLSD
jgi:hypothetical protein